MTCYVCVDDSGGMGFNHRRQSRDVCVLADIQRGIGDVLTIDVFSQSLVKEAGIPYVLAPEDLTTLPQDAHFFLECRPAREALAADTIVLYRWNRRYPADTHWDVDLAQQGYTLLDTTEFPGKSHDTITKEVYTR